jgi:hypothetical protein
MLQTFPTFAGSIMICKMKRFAILISAFLFVNIFLFLSSCSKNGPEAGMLTLQVMQPEYGVVPWENVYIATSLKNLQAHSYLDSSQTNVNGYVKFDTLDPGVYWYDTQHWEDYGAVEVFLGIDTRAILWVNTPGGGKK